VTGEVAFACDTHETSANRVVTCENKVMAWKDPAQKQAWMAQYREHNRERINAQHRAWRARNREKVREWRERDREKQRVWQTRRVHGMEPEDWAALWDAQDGLCYLCGADLAEAKTVDIDHDHSCCPPSRSCKICRRGLACHGCNIAIGNAGDDPVRLRRMADALEAAKRKVTARMADRETVMQLPLP
jgi:hypothetical protein